MFKLAQYDVCSSILDGFGTYVLSHKSLFHAVIELQTNFFLLSYLPLIYQCSRKREFMSLKCPRCLCWIQVQEEVTKKVVI